MSDNRRDGGRETWHRLREWDQGQAHSERLAAGILQAEGFRDVDPSHPLGGRDGGKDIRCKRDGRLQIAGVFFPRGQQTITAIKKKFSSDLANALKNGAEGFVFITNQEMTLGERGVLEDLAGTLPLTIYHLERIASILNSPAGYALRLEFLQLPMNIEEQTAFVQYLNRSVAGIEPPSLDINFSHASSGQVLGKSVSASVTALRYDETKIPQYGAQQMPLGIRIPPFGGFDNEDFYRDYIAFYSQRQLLEPFRLSVVNDGTVKLSNVTVKLESTLLEGLQIVGEEDILSEPLKKELFLSIPAGVGQERRRRRSVQVTERNGITVAICEMLDIKPKEEVQTDDTIYFGGNASGDITLGAKVFADNLPEPAMFTLKVRVRAKNRTLDIANYIAALEKELVH